MKTIPILWSALSAGLLDKEMPTATTHLEQMRILDPNEIPPIAIVGLGSLGSYITFGLVKLGAKKIIGCDPDVVENHNIGNQLYTQWDKGKPKAEALKDRLRDFMLDDQEVDFTQKSWDVGITAPIIITSVDNLETRKAVYDVVKNTDGWLIDPRSGGMVWKVYGIHGRNDQYEKQEFDPATVERTCGEDGIAYLSLRVAQEVMLNVKRIVSGEKVPYLVQGVEK